MKTFENYNDRAGKIVELYEKLSTVYKKGGFQHVRILRGQVDIFEAEHLDFVIFNDNYQIRKDEWGNIDIYGSFCLDKQ